MLLALQLPQNQKYGFLLQFITAVGLAINNLMDYCQRKGIGLDSDTYIEQRSAQDYQNMTLGQRYWEPLGKF